jgi:hypothetical protein
MPNRYIREGINDSERVDALSFEAESFYRRLLLVVDDHGRFSADPRLLRARAFPLRIDFISNRDIESWLSECCSATSAEKPALINAYEVGGKRYLQVSGFGQRIRSNSLYPDPTAPDMGPVAGTVYFILSETSGLIKIGYTERPVTERLSALQISTPDRLEVIGRLSGNQALERELHSMFAGSRVSGEWFKASSDLVSFIEHTASDGMRVDALCSDTGSVNA